MDQVREALKIVHDPNAWPAARQEAQGFLDGLNRDLSIDNIALARQMALNDEDPTVRHFGLSLIERSVATLREHGAAHTRDLQAWLFEQARETGKDVPYFILEKFALLWAKTAERTWGEGLGDPDYEENSNQYASWIDMDEQLYMLWELSPATRELVCAIFRTILEDLFILEDPVASKRHVWLTGQLMETFHPPEELAEQSGSALVNRTQQAMFRKLRGDEKGWILRISKTVRESGHADPRALRKILEVIKLSVPWVSITSLVNSGLYEAMILLLEHPDTLIRLTACESLQGFYQRSRRTLPGTIPEETWKHIYKVLDDDGGVPFFIGIFEKLQLDPDNIDDLEYSFLKKLAMLVVELGQVFDKDDLAYLTEQPHLGYFMLLLDLTRHASLQVSGIAVQFWCSVLRINSVSQREDVTKSLPDLLSIASQRCIKYSDLPESHPAKKFVEVDYDSETNAQAYISNYKTYMEDVVRLIVCRVPRESVSWLHNAMMEFFESEDGSKVITTVFTDTHQPAFILAFGQMLVVDAALKGISRWQVFVGVEERARLESDIIGLCERWIQALLSLEFADLTLRQRQLESLVQFAPLVRDNKEAVLSILNFIFSCARTKFPDDRINPSNDADCERVRSIRVVSGTELNRLGYMIPETLVQYYSDLERTIAGCIADGTVSEHESVSLRSFLLVVSQRSQMVDKPTKFSEIVDPVINAWNEPEMSLGLSHLDKFMERLGIARVVDYFRTRGVTSETNLSNEPMCQAGRLLKLELKQEWQKIFPIRHCRIFIQYTIERLDHKSETYQNLLALWKPRVQMALPGILKLITRIFEYNDPDFWQQFDSGIKNFLETSCRERFWQAGISMQTRDEFEIEGLQAAGTLQDFPDSVGHIVRYTREYAFLTLGSITQLESSLYEIEFVGSKLIEVLGSKSARIQSNHCWRHIITIVVRNTIHNCPPAYMARFLSEFATPFLRLMATLLEDRWKRQGSKGLKLSHTNNVAVEDLTEEMMEEHLLRQLTAVIVRLCMDLGRREKDDKQKILVCETATKDPGLVAALLDLSAQLLTYQDSRCCYNTCSMLLSLLTYSDAIKLPGIAHHFGDVIMPAIFGVFQDPYFHECQNEAGYVLVRYYDICNGMKCPNEFLERMQILTNAPFELINNLKQELENCDSDRMLRAVLTEFINQYSNSAEQNSTRSNAKNNRERALRSAALGNQNHETFNEEHYDAGALLNMFG